MSPWAPRGLSWASRMTPWPSGKVVTYHRVLGVPTGCVSAVVTPSARLLHCTCSLKADTLFCASAVAWADSFHMLALTVCAPLPTGFMFGTPHVPHDAGSCW